VLEKFKTIAKDSLIYSIGGLTGQFLGIFLVPIYTRIFSPDQYGIIDLIGTTTAFITLFLILGTDSAVARFYIDSDSDRDKKLTASTALYFRLLSVSLAILVLIFFSHELSFLIFKDEAYAEYLIIALLAIPFAMCYSFFIYMLRWTFQTVRYAVISVAFVLVSASLTIYLVVFLGKGILGIYWANLITCAIFSLIGFWITRENYTLTFSFKRLKEMLAFGMPMISTAICLYLMTYSDRYFLIYFTDLKEVGLYSIGNKVASLLGLVTMGFTMAWSPFVYSTYKEEDSKRTYAKVFDYFSVVSAFVVLSLSLFSRELLTIFTTEKYIAAYIVVPFLVTSLAVYTVSDYIFYIGMGIAKKNIHRIWIGGTAAIVNIILNFILIPVYGMVGAAIATLISFLLFGYLIFMMSQKYYHINYNFSANFKMYAVVAFIIFMVYSLFNPDITLLNITIKICLIFAFMISTFAFGIIGRTELYYIKLYIMKLKKYLLQCLTLKRQ
jgi:O-antigen/teichoic acid export membrane protein